MKTNHRFFVLALVLCGISANAQTFTYNGINYEVTSTSPKEVKVAKHSFYSGAAVIPNSIEYNSDTYAVTAIGEQAFYSCSGLTEVTISNSVTSIGVRAFTGCYNLTGTLTIPESVETIGEAAFTYCDGLTDIDVAADNPHYSSLGGVLFDKMQYTLIQCPGGKAGSYIIPESVKTIGERAFIAGKLTSVTIGNSVTSIGNYAFEYCGGLTGIDVAAGNLHYSSLNGVLFNKDKNTLIRYPAGKADSSYTIPNSVTLIGGSAFYGCSKLDSVTIGNSVKEIGAEAFYGCSGLTEVTIPNSVTSIGEMAFYDCSGLTSVTIGNSVETIGTQAFRNCSGLETIYVKAITPPAVIGAFYNVPTGIPVHVPCGTTATYKSTANWSRFTNYIDDISLLDLTVQSEDATKGTASITQTNTCDDSTAIITATPLTGYQFKQWSDGNTDNPRTLTITQDTVLTAIFESVNGIDGTQATALALYPNPVRDELFISGISGYANVEITDLSGRTVGVKNISPLQTGEISINLSHLAKGVYLIKIGNQTGKIVKE
ncbi:MAG: leucine-rich repeat protein [Prevotellaceae bacterium]|jgi:hypothetical protein|nr:leucine-rich repeat protein [Prevotellaceae bacterium]